MIDPDETTAQPRPLDPRDVETLAPNETAAELVRVLDGYMAALQAGEAPDRSALLAAHPGLASQLEPCLAGIDFIHKAASPEASGANPALLGEFRIIREVGRGGMGVVYEAEQTSLRRRVALKVLRFGVVADEEALRRFRVEAETVARLHHTNIVPIFAVGTEHDVSYYAMQFIEGRSLADVQEASNREGRPIAADEVARWGLQAAEALAHAHQRRVIHRDIKPSNLLIDAEGVVWLTDFGLAKRSDEVTLTLSGTLMGTPRYMSPEQAEAMKRPGDHRTDLYSLGATLYELATGRPVFESTTAHGVILQVLTAEPIAPRSIRSNIPRDLETILLTCLAKNPDRRYATAQALADDLRMFLEGRAIKARRTPIWEKAGRLLKRQKKSFVVGSIAAVATVLLVAVGLVSYRINEEAKLGKLSLSTSGDPFTAEILKPDSDERVGDPFTVPTRSPLPLPEGDYRVRLTAPARLSETYQLRLERGLPQDYHIDLSKRDFAWAPGQQTPTDRGWRAYPYAVEGRTDLIEIDSRAVSRVGAMRQPIWSFQVGNQSQLPPGSLANDWASLLMVRQDDSSHWLALCPNLLQPMPDLDGDGVGDLVISSAQKPFIFALAGKDGKVLWHRWLSIDDLPKVNPRCWTIGQPLLFDRPEGPVLVSTFDLGAYGTTDILVRRVEGIDARSGRMIWHREFAPRFDRAIPAQRLKLAGKEVIGVVSGKEWTGLDPFTGATIGATIDFAKLLTDGTPCRLIRQPLLADLDGDGSDDLVVLLEGADENHRVLMAVTGSGHRLWSIVLETPEASLNDLLDPDASWPRCADLDGDGRPEVLVPFQVKLKASGFGRHSIGVQAIDARDGHTRWSHRLRTDEGRVQASCQFAAGPDIDGDGVQDVFSIDFRPDDPQILGNVIQGTLFVDAISGKDGRSLWWWSQSMQFEYSRLRALRWWEPGSDGLPKLLVDVGSALFLFNDQPQFYLLETSTGRLIHEGHNFLPTGSGDLNGDGIADLWGTSTLKTTQAEIYRVVATGRPPEAWKRLGRWTPGEDYNGDGVADLVGPGSRVHKEVDAISGRDGRVLWQATPDREGMKQLTWNRNNTFSYTPLSKQLGDLDGDGVPEIVTTRDRNSNFHFGGLTIGLGVCSGRTGKMLWENPEIPWKDQYMSLSVPSNVTLIDVEGRGVPDVFALISAEGSRLKGSFVIYADFYLARFSGATGRLIASEKILVRNEGSQQPFGLAERDFASALADLDGDGRPEILFRLPTSSPSGEVTSEFLAVSTTDCKVVWSRKGAVKLDAQRPWEDNWRLFAAADLDGDSRADVILIDLVAGRPRVERWNVDSSTAPRWTWQGGEPELGGIKECSAIPRLADLDGSGKKSIVLIAGGDGGKQRVVVLDANGKLVRSRPIESVAWKVWTHDVDGDGKDEILFEDRGRLRACRGDLSTELWSTEPGPGSTILGIVKEFRLDASGKTVVVLLSGLAVEGATGKLAWRSESLGNGPLIAAGDGSLPLAVSMMSSNETTASHALPVGSNAKYLMPPARKRDFPPVTDDPRVNRKLPWVVGSPGGLGEKERTYLPAVVLIALGSGGFSFVVLVGPLWIFWQLIRKRGRVRDLLLIPVCLAAFLGVAFLIRSTIGPNDPANNFANTQSRYLAAALAFAGLPMLAVYFAIVRAVRQGWRSLPGYLALWAVGSAIAAAVLISFHHREWITPSERYSWDDWWTIWLPGLYAAGCLRIVWKIVAWPVKRLIRWRRADA